MWDERLRCVRGMGSCDWIGITEFQRAKVSCGSVKLSKHTDEVMDRYDSRLNVQYGALNLYRLYDNVVVIHNNSLAGITFQNCDS